MLVRYCIINHFFSGLFSVWLRLGVVVAMATITACSAYNPITPATSASQHQAAYSDNLRRDHQDIPLGYIVKYNYGGCNQSGTSQSAGVEIKQTHQDVSGLHAGNIMQFFEAETQPVAAQEGTGYELKMLNRLDGHIASGLNEASRYPEQFDDKLVYKLMSHNSMMQGGEHYGYQSVNQGLKGKGQGKGKGKIPGVSQVAVKVTPHHPVQQHSGVNQGGEPMSSFHSGYHHQNTAQGAGATTPTQLAPQVGVGQQQVHQGQVKGKGNRQVSQSTQSGVSQQPKVSTEVVIPSTTIKHLDPRQVNQYQQISQARFGGQSTYSHQPDYQLSSDSMATHYQASAGWSCANTEAVSAEIRERYRPVARSARLDGGYYWGYFNTPREIATGDSLYYVFSKPTCEGATWCQDF